MTRKLACLLGVGLIFVLGAFAQHITQAVQVLAAQMTPAPVVPPEPIIAIGSEEASEPATVGKFTLKQIKQSSYIWSVDASRPLTYLISDEPVELRFHINDKVDPKQPPQVALGNVNVVATSQDQKTWIASFGKLDAAALGTALPVSIRLPPNAPVSMAHSVVAPIARDDANALNIAKVANAAVANFHAVPSNELAVFNDYLRLGVNTKSALESTPRIMAFKKDGSGDFEFVPSSTSVNDWAADNAGLNWTTTLLRLRPGQFDQGQVYRLFVVGGIVANFRVSANSLLIRPTGTQGLKAPRITHVQTKTDTAKTIYLNTNPVSVKIEFDAHGALREKQTVVFVNDRPRAVAWTLASGESYTGEVDLGPSGEFKVQAALMLGDVALKSAPVNVSIRTTPLTVSTISPRNLAFTPGANDVTIRFDRPITFPDNIKDAIKFVGKDGTAVQSPNIKARQGNDEQSLIVQLENPAVGSHNMVIKKNGVDGQLGIVDLWGQTLAEDEQVVIYKPEGSELPLTAPGISSGTGPNVEFPEFTKRPIDKGGFNPSDHVETRVVRLYYYRDAHRVAQIVNREVQSYNRVAVDQRRRLAEQARHEALQKSNARKVRERQAVVVGQDARRAEQAHARAQEELAGAQQATQDLERRSRELTASLSEIQRRLNSTTPPANAEELRVVLDRAKVDQTDIATQLAKARERLRVAEEQVRVTLTSVQVVRNAEIGANETLLRAEQQEEEAAANQFRLEVAAAHTDPDTYAPGKLDSVDAVRQVSISVIGEAVIQLRGPIKGINIIRTMINQIDAPVGQVRVNIHTVQINGEHGDRMEKVAAKIQDYIDHSRFLTVQSALMLRKAVGLVASRKAQQILQMHPEESQAMRDEKYLYSFFGRDFVEELRALDSEFLRTGNKLLCLNSMDTTSLASALFVLGLAKNSTRYEIIQEFRRMIMTELPFAEQQYYEAGGYRKHATFGCDKFMLMAENARFQSFLGFFDAEIVGDDTLTPLQREFVRLAQIFKSRLIVELEYKQRVIERGLIEDRLGDYADELRKAKKKEEDAEKALVDAQKKLNAQRTMLSDVTNQADSIASVLLDNVQTSRMRLETYRCVFEQSVTSVVNDLKDKKRDVDEKVKSQLQQNKKVPAELTKERTDLENDISAVENILKTAPHGKSLQKDIAGKIQVEEVRGQVLLNGICVFFTLKKSTGLVTISDPDAREEVKKILSDAAEWARATNLAIRRFRLDGREERLLKESEKLEEELKPGEVSLSLDNVGYLRTIFSNQRRILEHIAATARPLMERFQIIVRAAGRSDVDVGKLHAQWLLLHAELERYVDSERPETTALRNVIISVNGGFKELIEANLQRDLAKREFQEARRPLDHKKLLDMLIDEVEDKYIELVEGTRAHTANIDNYIKQLATALEDDFNTQFYYPAFREIRKSAARFWDVTFSQIETTGILANNRSFAKVEPQATMEFDLPKRDITIVEAMNGAKALVDDYGALLQDPTFLALTKLRSGQPTTTLQQGQTPGVPPVLSPLPGLPRQSDERFLTATAPADKQFGSALEALIPDPAVYKFETGTGYEISPVIQPDGQSVVFHFNYLYTTNIREPVRADEKHLGRVKRHYIDTDVQLGNYELREISRYVVALKAARTSRGVPLLEDIPGLGILFRPLPSAESSLQENIVLGQSVIYPTLFDLMGLRWAPAVADLDPLALSSQEFVVRQRRRFLMNKVFDISSSSVDDFLRVPPAERRGDLYRTQETIPAIHPNGYNGPGLNLQDSQLREGYNPRVPYPDTRYVPRRSPNGIIYPPRQPLPRYPELPPAPRTEIPALPPPVPRNSLPPVQPRSNPPLPVPNEEPKATPDENLEVLPRPNALPMHQSRLGRQQYPSNPHLRQSGVSSVKPSVR